jgi:hypothetical protein
MQNSQEKDKRKQIVPFSFLLSSLLAFVVVPDLLPRLLLRLLMFATTNSSSLSLLEILGVVAKSECKD